MARGVATAVSMIRGSRAAEAPTIIIDSANKALICKEEPRRKFDTGHPQSLLRQWSWLSLLSMKIVAARKSFWQSPWDKSPL
ncbi:hypothetical protein TNCV_71091 [Trichonephila clavipes]|nr:hypothetical protein TNCV_71091 [Trichonephila clavipes]